MTDFKNILDEYRPAPFWSWNDRLDTEETARQIRIMKSAGLGGYFMHARGGLQTEYLSEEWFENIRTGIEQGAALKMAAWIYDENGWPSGFGGGAVSGKGIRYRQKYLRMEKGEAATERTICCRGGYHFYYDVNPYYVDTLDPEVTGTFLREIYEPYYERFGSSFEGVFTDEPQVSRDGIPWSFVLEEEYRRAYGEELLPVLPLLFLPEEGYCRVRIRFWKLVTELFARNYLKQIHDWCAARNLLLTGHLTLEESLEGQLTAHGACMPGYEYFDMPGMDWLGREQYSELAQLQVCSAAQQLGKKRILTESFAMCGHDLSFEEMKGILEWQMVRGVNVCCAHLQGYSLRGLRKRDYPPAMYFQQPWWEEYRIFTDAISRTGMILGEGRACCDTLVIHPQTLAWTLFDGGENRGIARLQERLNCVIRLLDEKHIPFHLGDELIMERHGSCEDGRLTVGACGYRCVIVMSGEALLDSTGELLERFRESGGRVISFFDGPTDWTCCGPRETEEDGEVIRGALGALLENEVTDNKSLLYTAREFDDCTVHYYVNPTASVQRAFLEKGETVLDAVTGEQHPFEGFHVFEPHGSLLTVETRSEQILTQGEWRMEAMSDNALLLDFCDYYFDGALQEKDGYALNIQNRACALGRPVRIRQVYRFTAERVPGRLFLACETPERFEITLNGRPLIQKDCGCYMDRAIRLLDLNGTVREGENTLALSCLFTQPERLYEDLQKARLFESEKNKLSYDMEIEPVFLVGGFCAFPTGEPGEAGPDAVRYRGPFAIAGPRTSLCPERFDSQGYPFFCGTLSLARPFSYSGRGRCRLLFEKQGISVIKLCVNGGEETTLLWGKGELDITDRLRKGENTLQLLLRNHLRNVLGPHHLREGNSRSVGPGSFFKESCVWNTDAEGQWDPDYCLVKTGVRIRMVTDRVV